MKPRPAFRISRTRVLTTPQGWWLIVVGCGVGFLFALVALCVSVVSFPLMLDRHAGAGDAMVTSLRAVAHNPVPMAAWGLIVAVLLVAGSLPFFLGLAVVIPLLGHATWHLYREVIEPELNPQPLPPRPPRERRPAADFPANLFPWRRKDGATPDSESAIYHRPPVVDRRFAVRKPSPRATIADEFSGPYRRDDHVCVGDRKRALFWPRLPDILGCETNVDDELSLERTTTFTSRVSFGSWR